MATAAIVILAGMASHADLGRLVNGLETAAGFADNPNDGVNCLGVTSRGTRLAHL